jgi:CRISPR/Cas system CMR-associated protein Cmr5 small subunit
MIVATISDKCFKIYVCNAHASTMVVMFKNRAVDQEQVKDAMERSAIWDQKYMKNASSW